MADCDGFIEASDKGVGIGVVRRGVEVKGAEGYDWGMRARLSRIFSGPGGRTVMLAFDHGFIMGPTSGLERVDLSINPLIRHADCLMCTRGMLRSVVPPGCGKPVCLRSDAGSSVLTELNRNVLIDVEDAVRLDASAMAVMVAMGDRETEALTVANLVRAADRGFQLGLPVMGVTAVGKDMARDARYFALASRVAAENGAAIVKTYYTEGFEKVANSCPVPIVVAGGKKLPELKALELAYRAVDSGAYGVDMGRNVFQSDAPAAMLQAISAVVHDLAKPQEAFELYRSLK